MALSPTDCVPSGALPVIAPTATLSGELGTSLYIPEASPTERCIAIAVFLVSFAYLCLFRRYAVMDPDEGIILQGAQRILHGAVLYRDFFSFYTPGSYYLLAGLFKIFGSSMGVARTALAVYGSTASLLAYLLARRVCTRHVALLTAALATSVALPFRFLVLHNWDSTFWACLGLYCAVRLIESPYWGWGFATGSFACLTFLFEQSKGAGLIFGLGTGLLAVYFLDDHEIPLKKLRFRALAGSCAAGLGWPLAVTVVYFGAHHSMSVMLADWFWPLQHYSVANRVPYGYQAWSDSSRQLLFSGAPLMKLLVLLSVSPCFVIPVLPLAAVALLLYWLRQMWKLRSTRSARAQARGAYYVLVNATLAGLLLSVVIVRADIVHFIYLVPLFFLVLAWTIDGRDIPGALFKSLRPWLNAYLVVAFVLLSMPLLLRAVTAAHGVATRKGVLTMPAGDTVVGYVEAHIAPGDSIFVYPYLPLYYYLTGTSNPTRYDYFQPGMHTIGQSNEIISQLALHPVRTVLFESSFADKIPSSWPETPWAAIANDPVADYILSGYRTCKILRSSGGQRFSFMVPRDHACP